MTFKTVSPMGNVEIVFIKCCWNDKIIFYLATSDCKFSYPCLRHHDAQHNDCQNNDIQHYDTQQNDIQ
jgi:hypothetical protein